MMDEFQLNLFRKINLLRRSHQESSIVGYIVLVLGFYHAYCCLDEIITQNILYLMIIFGDNFKNLIDDLIIILFSGKFKRPLNQPKRFVADFFF